MLFRGRRARGGGRNDGGPEQMVVSQLVPRGIRDERVLAAMRTVPRELFVPRDLRDRAYEDCPLPIGHEQTISQPYIVARMSELLELQGHERVLEVGAGCGYQSVILARLARCVCALELEAELVEGARRSFAALGEGAIDLRVGDGFKPWPDGGLFDGILCACAPAEVPHVLIRQLAPGGRLVLPVGEAGNQDLRVLRCGEDGVIDQWSDGPVRFVPMRHGPSLS